MTRIYRRKKQWWSTPPQRSSGSQTSRRPSKTAYSIKSWDLIALMGISSSLIKHCATRFPTRLWTLWTRATSQSTWGLAGWCPYRRQQPRARSSGWNQTYRGQIPYFKDYGESDPSKDQRSLPSPDWIEDVPDRIQGGENLQLSMLVACCGKLKARRGKSTTS